MYVYWLLARQDAAGPHLLLCRRAPSMPSLSNSPWIRGAPHSGLAMLISRISLRISGGIVGRPPRRLDFQRQYDLKPARCHFMTVSGFTITNAFRTVGANRYSPAKIERSMALNVCLS